MEAIVSIEILLPFTLTNTQFGNIAYYNKYSVNNTVQFPEEYSKLVTYNLPLGVVGFSHYLPGCDSKSIYEHGRSFL